MKILDHTKEHQPTLLRDVIEALVGKEVVVFGHYTITGKLVAYNGHLLHVHDEHNTIKDYYISAVTVGAIALRE